LFSAIIWRYIPSVRTNLTKSAEKALFGQLNGRNRIDAFEAAKRVWNIDGNAVAKQLIRTLRMGRRAFNRSAAAYAMQAVSSASVINALEKSVRNKSENPDVRGHAAEALAHRHGRSTHDVLIKALQDPTKEVRFWCAFALGQMREKKAVPILQLLLSDQRLVRGFHSVAKEAADAISEIEQREPERRCPYCIRSGRAR
jgi:HEAT repeat protein